MANQDKVKPHHFQVHLILLESTIVVVVIVLVLVLVVVLIIVLVVAIFVLYLLLLIPPNLVLLFSNNLVEK